jgi:hypothetical protein
MEYTTQEQFGEDVIKFQYKTESELYVVTKDIVYKLWKFDKKNPKGKKIAEDRLGSKVMEFIPDQRGD